MRYEDLSMIHCNDGGGGSRAGRQQGRNLGHSTVDNVQSEKW